MSQTTFSRTAAAVAAVWCCTGLAWLLVIAVVANDVVHDAHGALLVRAVAGVVSVFVVSALLYVVVRRHERRVTLERDSRERAYDQALAGWAAALDMRDHSTADHSTRVVALTTALAAHVGISDLVAVRRGALLHDIGKMGIPDAILSKEGPLTDDEWEVMRRHPQLAMDLLSASDYLGDALDIPYCHHERWDGTGYPRSLAGTDIPLTARLFAVVDAYDALTNARPYRAPLSHDQAMLLLHAESGAHFDPAAVEAFRAVMAERRGASPVTTGHRRAPLPGALGIEDLRH